MNYEVDATDLAQQLDEVSGPYPTGFEKWTTEQLVLFTTFVLCLSSALIVIPNRVFDPDIISFVYVFGILAIWRFSWWGTHAVRAEIYSARWPKRREKADRIWDKGWRPRQLYIQMTTYYEKPEITEEVVSSLLRQVRATGIRTTLFIGTAAAYDELVISDIAKKFLDVDVEIVFVRQNQPGKRMAIGLIMRAIMRRRPNPDDLILFMDGDAVLADDVFEKCCSMFALDPELQALTTDEEVICYGPEWMKRWLRMRFAQRRLAMQSHALSNKVLTLTGRMSMFRALHICNEKFIRTVEADHLDHWLWGRFRFLSGDDKSTWYHLLTVGAKMTYVPDAMVVTVEVIEGSGKDRMVANLRRWSGNMLRNGARAIALGPRQVGLFIWWCVVDQRLAMWTMLVGPTLFVMACFWAQHLVISFMLWIVLSRFALCFWLYRFARKADLTWPFLLYTNQVLNASVKILLLFRPNKQNWANRGNQKSSGGDSSLENVKVGIARAQLYVAVATFAIAVYSIAY